MNFKIHLMSKCLNTFSLIKIFIGFGLQKITYKNQAFKI
jgi:hypothetical protein